MFKNRISAATGRRKKEAPKKDPIWEERGKRVYVLPDMAVTFPTCHLERSPLKASAPANTVHHTALKKNPTI